VLCLTLCAGGDGEGIGREFVAGGIGEREILYGEENGGHEFAPWGLDDDECGAWHVGGLGAEIGEGHGVRGWFGAGGFFPVRAEGGVVVRVGGVI
jgi:hypothetical protein